MSDTVKITQVKYVSDPEFFKDEICGYPPCENPGFGFARGEILCEDHYSQALEIMGVEEGDSD